VRLPSDTHPSKFPSRAVAAFALATMNSEPMTFDSTIQSAPSLAIDGSSAAGGFDDSAVAAWLKDKKVAKRDVVLLRAGTTCKVYEKGDARGILYAADPEKKAKTVLKALAKQRRLLTVDITQEEMADVTVARSNWVPQAISDQEIAAFIDKRAAKLGRAKGRGEKIKPEVATQVWADAGGCCMFKGCAADLSTVPLYNVTARVGYLAHIVASDPEGPRGNATESHPLSNRADNIMLMCDAHHRLIDCFALDKFGVDRLREMRREHTAMVRKYRAAMQLPVAQAVTIFADLGGIPTHYPDSEFMEALLAEGFAMNPHVARHLTYKNRDDRTPPDFWGNYLREMFNPITRMFGELGGQAAKHDGDLAIFGVHHIPTLVLAGRIIGEARTVHVFQRSRARASWLWNAAATAHSPGTFKLDGLSDNHVDEVLMTVELTAAVELGTLPNALCSAVTRGEMPWIRLTTVNPDSECIQRKEDLAQALAVARRAINGIQDRMRAKRVHLVVVSPASVAFGIGQLMQPGHHAEFKLYDRPNRDNPFREAFTINGFSVVPPAGSTQPPILIR
jgi:hypothetical protein